MLLWRLSSKNPFRVSRSGPKETSVATSEDFQTEETYFDVRDVEMEYLFPKDDNGVFDVDFERSFSKSEYPTMANVPPYGLSSLPY